MNRAQGTMIVLSALTLVACRPAGAEKSSQTEPTNAVIGERADDPDSVALARAALACKSRFDLFDTSCDAYQRWITITRPRADATSVSLLESADVRLRFLGAIALTDDAARVPGSPSYRTDRALASRLVAAAAKETSREVGERVGWHVGRIDVEKTGQLEPIEALVRERRQPESVRRILENLLASNATHRPTYDFLLSATNDPDDEIRKAAVGAFWMGGSLSIPETCKMWEAHLDDSSAEIAGESAHCLGMTRGCGASYDPLLSKTAARVAARTTKDAPGFALGIEELCKSKESTPSQRSKGAALGKQLAVDKQVGESLRRVALRATMACDASGGRSFVSGFTKDEVLGKRAREILAAK